MSRILDLTDYDKVVLHDLSLNSDLSCNTNKIGSYGPTGVTGPIGITGPQGPAYSGDAGTSAIWTLSGEQITYFNYENGSIGSKKLGIGVDPDTYSSSPYGVAGSTDIPFGVRSNDGNTRTDFYVNSSGAVLNGITLSNGNVSNKHYIQWNLGSNPGISLARSTTQYFGMVNNHPYGNSYQYAWEANEFRFYGSNTSFRWLGYVHRGYNNTRMNFTGQHRTFIKNIPFNKATLYQGLIVCSNNDTYIDMKPGRGKTLKTPVYGKEAISIDESLPIVSLSNKEKDISVFGVISNIEEVNDDGYRIDQEGVFGTNIEKEHGDRRIHINSIGEGAIWVSNKNGNLLSGTYITSSSIPGYGQKQDDERLANYSVAKITMDCDFNPTLQNIKKIKTRDVTFTNMDSSGNYYDVSGNVLIYTQVVNYNVNAAPSQVYRNYKYNIITDTSDNLIDVKQNILDSNDEIQWEDTDEQEYAYDIRYIDPSGNIITKEQHDSTISSGGMAYIAAFVGCTYHCG